MGVTCCNNISEYQRKNKFKSLKKLNSNDKFDIDDNRKYSEKEINLILNDFIKQTIKNKELFEQNDDDESFNSQEKYEKSELNKFFELNEEKINREITIAINSSEKNSVNKDYFINKLVSDIIYLEDGKKLYLEKIEKIIKANENNKNTKNNKINKRINILVIGKDNVGKKTLINKIFKLKNLNMNIVSNFGKEIQEYERKELPFFKFIYLKNNNNLQFGLNSYKDKIINYINEQYRTNNINNYVNIIWYCFNNGFLNYEEIELIKSLNNSYNNIPLILVHTMSINMQQVSLINNLNIDKENLVIVLAEDFISQMNGIFINSFGIDFLIVKTLEKYKNSYSINNETKNHILNIIKSKNKDLYKYAYEQIKLNFIKEYNLPKNDYEFIQYLNDIFGLNIKYFLTKVMTKESINRINQENILIKPMMKFIEFYHEKSKQLIEPVIDSYALNFSNYQNNMLKGENNGFILKNSRNLDDIKKNIRKYLTDNYIYIFQKHYIYKIFFEKYRFFCEYFKKEFDILSEQIILNMNINNILFEKFEKEVMNFFGINININNNANMNNNFGNNSNDNKEKDLNISMMSDTIINNNSNGMNNAMNILNDNQYAFINYKLQNDNNINNMNFFNNNNFININNNMNNNNNFVNMNNNNNFNFVNMNNNNNFINNNMMNQVTMNLPSKSEVEMNFNTNK